MTLISLGMSHQHMKEGFLLMICASWFDCLAYDFIPAQITFWVAVFLSKMDTNTDKSQFGWMHFLTSVLLMSIIGIEPTFCFAEHPFSCGSTLRLASLFTSSLWRLCCIELNVCTAVLTLVHTSSLSASEGLKRWCQQALITSEPSCIFSSDIFWVAFQIQLVARAIRARTGCVVL